MARPYNVIGTKFVFDTSDFKRSSQELSERVTLIRKEMTAAQKSVVNFRKDKEALNITIAGTAQIIDEETQRLEALRKEYDRVAAASGASSDKALGVQKKLLDQEIKLSRLRASLAGYQQDLKDLQNPLKQVGNYLGLTTNGFTIMKGAISTLVVDGFKRLLHVIWTSKDAFIEYQAAFNEVRKTVDGTAGDLEYLSGNIQALSSVVIPRAAEELAKLAAVGGQFGLAAKDLSEFTSVMAMIADSTNVTAETAGTTAARFQALLGLETKDFERFGSTLVSLGNNFSTTEDQIITMAEELAGIASISGLDTKGTLALATAISSLGQNAEAGSTSISKLINKISGASKEELAKFGHIAGVTGEEFKQAFEEDALNAISMFVEGLHNAGSQTGEILKGLGLSEVRVGKTLNTLASAFEQLPKAIETANKAWEENIALAKEAYQRYDSIASKLQIMTNSWDDAKRSIFSGTFVGDLFENGVESITTMSREFTRIIDPEKGFNDIIQETNMNLKKYKIAMMEANESGAEYVQIAADIARADVAGSINDIVSAWADMDERAREANDNIEKYERRRDNAIARQNKLAESLDIDLDTLNYYGAGKDVGKLGHNTYESYAKNASIIEKNNDKVAEETALLEANARRKMEQVKLLADIAAEEPLLIELIEKKNEGLAELIENQTTLNMMQNSGIESINDYVRALKAEGKTKDEIEEELLAKKDKLSSVSIEDILPADIFKLFKSDIDTMEKEGKSLGEIFDALEQKIYRIQETGGIDETSGITVDVESLSRLASFVAELEQVDVLLERLSPKAEKGSDEDLFGDLDERLQAIKLKYEEYFEDNTVDIKLRTNLEFDSVAENRAFIEAAKGLRRAVGQGMLADDELMNLFGTTVRTEVMKIIENNILAAEQYISDTKLLEGFSTGPDTRKYDTAYDKLKHSKDDIAQSVADSNIALAVAEERRAHALEELNKQKAILDSGEASDDEKAAASLLVSSLEKNISEYNAFINNILAHQEYLKTKQNDLAQKLTSQDSINADFKEFYDSVITSISEGSNKMLTGTTDTLIEMQDKIKDFIRNVKSGLSGLTEAEAEEALQAAETALESVNAAVATKKRLEGFDLGTYVNKYGTEEQKEIWKGHEKETQLNQLEKDRKDALSLGMVEKAREIEIAINYVTNAESVAEVGRDMDAIVQEAAGKFGGILNKVVSNIKPIIDDILKYGIGSIDGTQDIEDKIKAIDKEMSDLRDRSKKEMESLEEYQEARREDLRDQLEQGEIDQADYYANMAANEASANEMRARAQEAAAKKEEELSKKKNALAKKAFEANKKNATAQVLLNFAIATAKLYADLPVWAASVATGALTALMLSQLGTIREQEYVPAFAKGGVIDKPTIGLVGEAGKEVILPIERNLEWIDRLAERLSIKMQSNSVSNLTDSHNKMYTINQNISATPRSHREIYLQTKRAMEDIQ